MKNWGGDGEQVLHLCSEAAKKEPYMPLGSSDSWRVGVRDTTQSHYISEEEGFGFRRERLYTT